MRSIHLCLVVAALDAACGADDLGASDPSADVVAAEPAHRPPIMPIRDPDRPHPLAGGTLAPTTYGNGPVISSVEVVPALWNGGLTNGTIRSELHCFYTALVHSPFMDMMAEFDTPTQTIGRGSVDSTVSFVPTRTSTSLSHDDIQNEIAHQIDVGTLPAPNANTLYMVQLPPRVVVHAFGDTSCVDFCAYHDSFSHNSKQIRYGVLPDDSPGSGCDTGCGPGGVFGSMSASISHELAEAVTDPDPFSGWTNSAGEIADGCSASTTLPGTNYLVQQLESNTAGAMCVNPPAGSTTTEPPIVSSISQIQGPFDATTTVTAMGSCLASPHATVQLGFSSATVSVTPSTSQAMSMTIPVSPAGTPGNATIFITNFDGSGPAAKSFAYQPTGTITIGPDSGPIQGGTLVTLHGQGFATGASVIDFNTAGSVTHGTSGYCSSSTTCTVYTPAHDPGTATVTININGIQAFASNPFNYVGPQITSVSPNAGPITGGTALTVHATNITATSQNTFTGTATIGGVVAGTAYCIREGLYEADCTVTTPTLPSVPAAPLDVRLTITHTTHTQLTTPITTADQFTYRAQPTIARFDLGPPAYGGETRTIFVTLDGKAAPGTTVVLSQARGPTGVVTFPSAIPISAGSLSGSFLLTVTAQNLTSAIGLDAAFAGSIASSDLAIRPTPAPTFDDVPPMCAGQSFVETIELAEPAPAGATLSVSTDDPIASVPSSVSVAAGAHSATVTVTVASTPTTVHTVHLNASYFGIAAAPVAFTVSPGVAVSLGLSPSTITAGNVATATVTLCTAAPYFGAVVSLSSSNSAATVPATVVVNGGATTASAVVSTSTVNVPTFATIAARYLGASSSRSLTIQPASCGPKQISCSCPSGAHGCVSVPMTCASFCALH
jgi:hypothetical protein